MTWVLNREDNSARRTRGSRVIYAPLVWILRKQPHITGKICFNPNPMRYSVASVQRCGQDMLLIWWLMRYPLVLHPHLWFSQVIWAFINLMLQGCLKVWRSIFSLRVPQYCFLSWLLRELQRLTLDKGQMRTRWAELWQCFSLWWSTVQLNRSLAWHQEGNFCKASPAFCFSLQQSTWLAAGMPSGALALWEPHGLSPFSAPWHRDFERPCSAWDPMQQTLCGGIAEPVMCKRSHGVLDCMGWGGHLGVKLLKNKVRGLHRDSGEVSFQNKGNRLLQWLSLSKAVTRCFTAWLCLLLLCQLSYLLLFSARPLSTPEHQIVRHKLMGPP